MLNIQSASILNVRSYGEARKAGLRAAASTIVFYAAHALDGRKVSDHTRTKQVAMIGEAFGWSENHASRLERAAFKAMPDFMGVMVANDAAASLDNVTASLDRIYGGHGYFAIGKTKAAQAQDKAAQAQAQDAAAQAATKAAQAEAAQAAQATKAQAQAKAAQAEAQGLAAKAEAEATKAAQAQAAQAKAEAEAREAEATKAKAVREALDRAYTPENMRAYFEGLDTATVRQWSVYLDNLAQVKDAATAEAQAAQAQAEAQEIRAEAKGRKGRKG